MPNLWPSNCDRDRGVWAVTGIDFRTKTSPAPTGTGLVRGVRLLPFRSWGGTLGTYGRTKGSRLRPFPVGAQSALVDRWIRDSSRPFDQACQSSSCGCIGWVERQTISFYEVSIELGRRPPALPHDPVRAIFFHRSVGQLSRHPPPSTKFWVSTHPPARQIRLPLWRCGALDKGLGGGRQVGRPRATSPYMCERRARPREPLNTAHTQSGTAARTPRLGSTRGV